MSIIYDALKKAQKAIDLRPEVKSHREPAVVPKDKRPQAKSRIKSYLLYVFISCLGLFIANIFFASSRNPMTPAVGSQSKLSNSSKGSQVSPAAGSQISTAKSEAIQQAIQQAESSSLAVSEPKKEPPVALVLNGVFSSGNEGYCLINNQIAKVGDVIDGAKVLRINPDNVELERDGVPIKLKTSSR